MMNKSIEEIRMENERLYNEFSTKCEEVQQIIRNFVKELKEDIDNTASEEYVKHIEELKLQPENKDAEFANFEEFIENLKDYHIYLLTVNSNLSCYKIDLKSRDDYDNKNKALSYYYELSYIIDYINNAYKEVKRELM